MGMIRQIDIKSGKVVKTWKAHKGHVESLAISKASPVLPRDRVSQLASVCLCVCVCVCVCVCACVFVSRCVC